MSVVPIEQAILAFCSDQINLSSLVSTGDTSAIHRAEISQARQRIADLEKKLERVTAALVDDDGGATPIAFVRKARELESQIAAAKAEERTAAVNLERTVNRSTPTIANEWRALVSAALNFDYDARMKVRQLVADTFESIVIYHNGVMPDGKKVAPIDIVLIAKGGTPRMLRIDRKTGEWIAQEDASS